MDKRKNQIPSVLRFIFEDFFLQKAIGLLSILSLFLSISCVEEIDFQNDTFESILVVDATITNENKLQEIQLSRTFEFGEQENPEENAQVGVVGNGTEYIFEEIAPGTYQSVAPFRAEATMVYKLHITTSNGSQYSSLEKQLTTETPIDNLYAERIVNDDGVDGIAILVASFDPTNTANYYRYTFEETYKIIAPFWRPTDAYVKTDFFPFDPSIDFDFERCQVGLRPRSENQRICFTTEISTGINLATTSQLNNASIEGHLVNFLANDNYKISYRYSLLAQQFVISEEAHSYLEIIQSFTSQGSLFSQVQTGFVLGNISATLNPEEKVIGIFDVVSVSSQRLFFDRNQFYPNMAPPPFLIDCTILSAPSPLVPGPNAVVCGDLINIINRRTSVYLEDYKGVPVFYIGPNDPPPGPYLMIPQACGDCTILGAPEPPSFWED